VRIALLVLMGAVVLPLAAQEKPRVFITPSAVRRTEGYKSPTYSERNATVEDRTIEMSRDFAESCKEVTVSTERRKVDYIVRLNWKLGRSQVAVYHTNGDLVGVEQKGSIGGAVKKACELIKKDQLQARRTDDKPEPAANPTK
jgi:hypothetical protein